MENGTLTIYISSFSYKKDLLIASPEHGMGFVFDMRGIHNPGRYDAYKYKTGLDTEVIRYLEQHTEISHYLSHVYSLLEITLSSFLERKFSSLQVNFGCTGGQHRSVYAAEQTQTYINQHFPTIITHIDHQNRKNWVLSDEK